jgi:hypothetical protein
MDGDGSQAYGLLFLGVLAFLPGMYYEQLQLLCMFFSCCAFLV